MALDGQASSWAPAGVVEVGVSHFPQNATLGVSALG
jgi:hypothetical protein